MYFLQLLFPWKKQGDSWGEQAEFWMGHCRSCGKNLWFHLEWITGFFYWDHWEFKGNQLRQSLQLVQKTDFLSDLSNFLVNLYQQQCLCCYFCVCNREICVDICFHLFCKKIYIFLPLHSTSATLLVRWSQAASVLITEIFAFYRCWSYTKDAV